MFYFFFCTLSNTVNYLWSELFTSSTFILGARFGFPTEVKPITYGGLIYATFGLFMISSPITSLDDVESNQQGYDIV